MDESNARLFAVVRSRGPAWLPGRPLEEQPERQAHAAYMNALQQDRFVRLGGPLEGTSDVLLIVRAASRDDVAARLADDPWSLSGLLRLTRADIWHLRLGAL